MKLAIATWNNRVAPVFDVAGSVTLVKIQGGTIIERREVSMDRYDSSAKVRFLLEEGVHELVCGAISRDVEGLVRESGIRLFPFIAGDTEAVIQAWMGRQLDSSAYWMPGCGRRRWGNRHGRGRGCGAGGV